MNNLQITIDNLGSFEHWGRILDIEESTVDSYRVLSIHNSFEIKEELKNKGFKFNSSHKLWYKAFEVSEIEEFLLTLKKTNDISLKYGVQPSASVGLESFITTTTNKSKTRYTSVMNLQEVVEEEVVKNIEFYENTQIFTTQTGNEKNTISLLEFMKQGITEEEFLKLWAWDLKGLLKASEDELASKGHSIIYA